MTNVRLTRELIFCLGAVAALLGCAPSRNLWEWRPVAGRSGEPAVSEHAAASPPSAFSPTYATSGPQSADTAASPAIQLVSDERPARGRTASSTQVVLAPEEVSPLPGSGVLQLEEVIDSVIASYPLLRSAILGRSVAEGEWLAAAGEFDLKLKALTLDLPLGNYENYRHAIGAEQPLLNGGSLFGGYRLGRGEFQTYYGDRQTDQGGEFKAGVTIPLIQNRDIDDRRAGLWRNRWELQAVEPEIQATLIELIRVASLTYWNWVAAGHNVRIVEDLLTNATERTEGLQTRVERGDAPAIELTDNERLIVARRTKLIDAERKFQQAAYKLSLFLRDESGQPRVIEATRLPPEFPPAVDPSQRDREADIASAIANRPELRALAILTEQLNIDLAAARNLGLPQLDGLIAASQDVGDPADPKKHDKSELEFEGGLMASVPLQRRKAQGKVAAVQGKLAQVRAKTQFTREKIVADVQYTSAALEATFQQLEQSHRSLELARQMEAAERRKFELGDSNLLLVNIREQATADAAATELEARLNYFDAQADYRAALGSDATR